MKNKFLIIVISLLIGLSLTNQVSAVDPLPTPKNATTTNISEGQAVLEWEYPAYQNDNLKQFKILWRNIDSSEWTAAYPSKTGGPEYEYVLNGLFGDTSYEWRIRAEGASADYDSIFYEGEETSFTTPESSWEEENPDEEEDTGGTSPEGGEAPTIENFFQNITNFQEGSSSLMDFLVLAGFAVGPMLILYASFLLITKQDDPKATSQAKKIILWTILALSLMLFARGIPSIVKSLFS